MKISVGTQFGSKKITIEEEGKRVVIEPHYNQDNVVSVAELARSLSNYPKGLLELLAGISSLDIYPEEPSFWIRLKDGRSVWIRIGPEQILVLCYSKFGPLPKTTVVSLPQKTLEVFQEKKD